MDEMEGGRYGTQQQIDVKLSRQATKLALFFWRLYWTVRTTLVTAIGVSEVSYQPPIQHRFGTDSLRHLRLPDQFEHWNW